MRDNNYTIFNTDGFVHAVSDDNSVTLCKNSEAFLEYQYYVKWGVFSFDDATVTTDSDVFFEGQLLEVDIGRPHAQADIVIDGTVEYTEVSDMNNTITVNTMAENSGTYEIIIDSKVLYNFEVVDLQSFDKETVSDNIISAIADNISDEMNTEQFFSEQVEESYWNDTELPQHIKSKLNDMLCLEPSKTNNIQF